MKIRRGLVLAGLCLSGVLSGCEHYYRVEDPSGGKQFYTDNIDRQDSGTIIFKSLETGEVVTLQNSSVKEVNKGDLPPNLVK